MLWVEIMMEVATRGTGIGPVFAGEGWTRREADTMGGKVLEGRKRGGIATVCPGGFRNSKQWAWSQCARSSSVTTAWCQRGGLCPQPVSARLAVTQEPSEAAVSGFSVGDRDADKI